MLNWPLRAMAAVQKLFEPLQAVDVYVEDTNDDVFYRRLLNHATKGEIEVARVYGLGGRDAVVRLAMTHDQTKRRALFIIDGDLSWVLGDSLTSVDGLYRHEAYCIENLLFCELAIARVVSEELAVLEDVARERVGLKEWRASILSPLLELFAAFATVHRLNPTVETVAQKVGTMCSVESGGSRLHKLDVAKVDAAKRASLDSAMNACDSETTMATYSRVLERIKAFSEPMHAISGKDFLLPLLDFHLQSLGCRIKRKALRVRLAGTGNIDRFKDLASALKHAARRTW